jgi:uncharacterized protein DUF5667
MSAESDSFSSTEHEPTRALLFAQALESCILAERRMPGASAEVIARQPAWARAELRRLVRLAEALDAAATRAVMSEEFRVAARERLMQRIAPDSAELYPTAAGQNGHHRTNGVWLTSIASRNGYHVVQPRRPRWLLRSSLGGLLAATLVVGATLTASANALPGEPLYSVKQVREELGVRFAASDDARTLALLNQADARLDETARLLEMGRTDQAAQTTQRFDDALAQATTTYVVTIADAGPSDPTPDAMESKLTQQEDQLQTMLASAPEPARADLRQALVATERTRALVTEPQPVERRAARPSVVVAAPTVAAEVEPTRVPEALVPPPVDLVAQPTSERIAEDTNDDRHEGRSARGPGSDDEQSPIDAPTAVVARDVSPPPITTRPANVMPTTRQNGRRGDVRVAPVPAAVVVEDDGGGDGDTPRQQQGERDTGGVVAITQPADRKSDGDRSDGGDDHVVAPPQNQNDARDRVAQQPSQPSAVVANQRQSGGGGGGGFDGGSGGGGGGGGVAADTHGDGNARQSAAQAPAVAVAQTSPATTGRAASRDGDDSSQTPRVQAPTPVPSNARSQPTPAPSNTPTRSGDDRHGGDTQTNTTQQTTRTTSGQTTQTSSSQTTSSSSTGGGGTTSGDGGGDRTGGGKGH